MDAADLAQDTFTRILASQVTVIDQPRAYLSCVAKGILVNWYQRKALERAYLDALAQLPAPEAPSPEARFMVLETLHEIDAMLDALPRAGQTRVPAVADQRPQVRRHRRATGRLADHRQALHEAGLRAMPDAGGLNAQPAQRATPGPSKPSKKPPTG